MTAKSMSSFLGFGRKKDVPLEEFHCMDDQLSVMSGSEEIITVEPSVQQSPHHSRGDEPSLSQLQQQQLSLSHKNGPRRLSLTKAFKAMLPGSRKDRSQRGDMTGDGHSSNPPSDTDNDDDPSSSSRRLRQRNKGMLDASENSTDRRLTNSSTTNWDSDDDDVDDVVGVPLHPEAREITHKGAHPPPPPPPRRLVPAPSQSRLSDIDPKKPTDLLDMLEELEEPAIQFEIPVIAATTTTATEEPVRTGRNKGISNNTRRLGRRTVDSMALDPSGHRLSSTSHTESGAAATASTDPQESTRHATPPGTNGASSSSTPGMEKGVADDEPTNDRPKGRRAGTPGKGTVVRTSSQRQRVKAHVTENGKHADASIPVDDDSPPEPPSGSTPRTRTHSPPRTGTPTIGGRPHTPNRGGTPNKGRTPTPNRSGTPKKESADKLERQPSSTNNTGKERTQRAQRTTGTPGKERTTRGERTYTPGKERTQRGTRTSLTPGKDGTERKKKIHSPGQITNEEQGESKESNPAETPSDEAQGSPKKESRSTPGRTRSGTPGKRKIYVRRTRNKLDGEGADTELEGIESHEMMLVRGHTLGRLAARKVPRKTSMKGIDTVPAENMPSEFDDGDSVHSEKSEGSEVGGASEQRDGIEKDVNPDNGLPTKVQKRRGRRQVTPGKDKAVMASARRSLPSKQSAETDRLGSGVMSGTANPVKLAEALAEHDAIRNPLKPDEAASPRARKDNISLSRKALDENGETVEDRDKGFDGKLPTQDGDLDHVDARATRKMVKDDPDVKNKKNASVLDQNDGRDDSHLKSPKRRGRRTVAPLKERGADPPGLEANEILDDPSLSPRRRNKKSAFPRNLRSPRESPKALDDEKNIGEKGDNDETGGLLARLSTLGSPQVLDDEIDAGNREVGEIKQATLHADSHTKEQQVRDVVTGLNAKPLRDATKVTREKVGSMQILSNDKTARLPSGEQNEVRTTSISDSIYSTLKEDVTNSLYENDQAQNLDDGVSAISHEKNSKVDEVLDQADQAKLDVTSKSSHAPQNRETMDSCCDDELRINEGQHDVDHALQPAEGARRLSSKMFESKDSIPQVLEDGEGLKSNILTPSWYAEELRTPGTQRSTSKAMPRIQALDPGSPLKKMQRDNQHRTAYGRSASPRDIPAWKTPKLTPKTNSISSESGSSRLTSLEDILSKGRASAPRACQSVASASEFTSSRRFDRLSIKQSLHASPLKAPKRSVSTSVDRLMKMMDAVAPSSNSPKADGADISQDHSIQASAKGISQVKNLPLS